MKEDNDVTLPLKLDSLLRYESGRRPCSKGHAIPPTMDEDDQIRAQVWPESDPTAALNLELESLESSHQRPKDQTD